MPELWLECEKIQKMITHNDDSDALVFNPAPLLARAGLGQEGKGERTL